MSLTTSGKFKKPTSDKERLLQSALDVIRIRVAEDVIRSEYPKDEMKTPVHLANGAEAIAAGVIAALPEQSKLFGTYRSHGLYIASSHDLDGFYGELFGKETGCGEGKAGSMHLSHPESGLMITSAVVGTTIPVAVGSAMASAMKGEKRVTAVFFGDGAVEEGVFWESLNFACLKKLRILFVCEDNGLAIHSKIKDRQSFDSVTEAVAGFPCHRFSSDGFDPSQTFEITQQALRAMEKDPKPSVLHFKYLRQLEHVGIHEDFSAGYRPEPSTQERAETDPLIYARKSLKRQGWDEAKIKGFEADTLVETLHAMERARKAVGPLSVDLYKHIAPENNSLEA